MQLKDKDTIKNNVQLLLYEVVERYTKELEEDLKEGGSGDFERRIINTFIEQANEILNFIENSQPITKEEAIPQNKESGITDDLSRSTVAVHVSESTKTTLLFEVPTYEYLMVERNYLIQYMDDPEDCDSFEEYIDLYRYDFLEEMGIDMNENKPYFSDTEQTDYSIIAVSPALGVHKDNHKNKFF